MWLVSNSPKFRCSKKKEYSIGLLDYFRARPHARILEKIVHLNLKPLLQPPNYLLVPSKIRKLFKKAKKRGDLDKFWIRLAAIQQKLPNIQLFKETAIALYNKIATNQPIQEQILEIAFGYNLYRTILCEKNICCSCTFPYDCIDLTYCVCHQQAVQSQIKNLIKGIRACIDFACEVELYGGTKIQYMY